MNKKKLRLRKLFLILALFQMIGIFYFSSRPADLSEEDSQLVGRIVGELFYKDFDSLSAEEQDAFAESIDHPVRKCAHATEYAVLGILLLEGIENPAYAWLLTVSYAGTDEFHQLFVEGRSGQVSDVCIDGCGALLGIVIVRLLQKRKQKGLKADKFQNRKV